MDMHEMDGYAVIWGLSPAFVVPSSAYLCILSVDGMKELRISVSWLQIGPLTVTLRAITLAQC
jgi:hypothetical protein